MKSVTVNVPATTANLGPGFDCLAMALDLWNITTFTLGGKGLKMVVSGEGENCLPANRSNLLVKAFDSFFKSHGQEPPQDLFIESHNHIPLGSGLGSSAAAVLSGLIAANLLMGSPDNDQQILQTANQFEGHPDNITAALLGGLVIVVADAGALITRSIEPGRFQAAVAVPAINVSTHQARSVLPQTISLQDAVFNLGHTALVLEAMRNNDLDLLSCAMHDRLHQPYRLKLFPGSEQAIEAAKAAGAAAVAISGAGPSIIAFTAFNAEQIANDMAAAFQKAGVSARPFALTPTARGARTRINQAA